MKRAFLSVMFGLLVSVSGTANAAESGFNLGLLTCTADPDSGYNLVITSSVNVDCVFTDSRGEKESYIGETGIGLGVNLNFKAKEQIAFTVLGAIKEYRTGTFALAGKYVGAKASATVGVGVGAAVLVGGGENNFSLQPVALEANQGLGAAAGLGYLYIQAKPEKKTK